jgi:hypothetical protein
MFSPWADVSQRKFAWEKRNDDDHWTLIGMPRGGRVDKRNGLGR